MYSIPQHYLKRILTEEQANSHRSLGYKKADLHVHSSCSHDVLPAKHLHPESIYQTAFNAGLDFITITDHDTMDAYDIIGWERERLVTGVEISLFDPVRVGHTIHVNVYLLNRAQFNELEAIATRDKNIDTFVTYLNDQNLPYTYNHPFWFLSGETPNYRAVEEIIDLFPVVEYNMKRVQKKNVLAMMLAAKYNKGITASTDTHVGQIGHAYSLAKGGTFRDYFENIAKRDSFIVPQDLNLTTLNNEIGSWIQVLFNLEEIKDEDAAITGMAWLDRPIRFFARRKYEDHPRVFSSLEYVLNEFVNNRFVSFCYVHSQNRNARKIFKHLHLDELQTVDEGYS